MDERCACQLLLSCLMYVVLASALHELQEAPTMLYSPTNLTVLVHRTPKHMQCVASGEPFPTVTWQHSRSIADDNWQDIRRHMAGRYRYVKSGQKLEFRKLLLTDNGFYRCVAKNVLGSIYSDVAFLNIQAEAKIVELYPRLNTTVVSWGSELVLRCIAEGVPVPDIRWTVNGKQLHSTLLDFHPTYAHSEVRINATYSAEYQCSASNDHVEGRTLVVATTDVIVTEKKNSDISSSMEAQIQDELLQKEMLIAAAVGTVTVALVLVAVAAVLCCRFCHPKFIIISARKCDVDSSAGAVTKSPAAVLPVDFEVDVERLPSNAIYCQKHSDPDNVKLQSFECRRNDLQYCRSIAHGAFGQIFEASAMLPGQGIMTQTSVAVKVLDENDPEMEREFLRLALVHADLSGHVNVIQLLGVCLTLRPYCVVLEYANGGDLHRFLRDSAPDHFIERWRRVGNQRESASVLPSHLTVAQQVDICRQIAAGMAHVVDVGFVHRDLAARNCLVSIPASSPHRIDVKLADFGLARRLPLGATYYEGVDAEEIAVRWTAIEAIIDGRFSLASDIWSFGVTVWEVFSFASRPYGDLDSTSEVVRRVVGGRTLDRPDGTPDGVYDMMLSCWSADPSSRPPFTQLEASLATMKQRLKH